MSSSNSQNLPDIIAKRQKAGDIVVLGGLGLLAGYAGLQILPYALSLLNMIQTGVFRMLAIGGALVVAYVGATMMPTLIRGLKVLSRFLTNQLVAVDPIGFMKELMSKLEERKAWVREKVGALKAALKAVKEEREDLLRGIDGIRRKAQVVADPRQAEFLGRDLERKERSLASVEARIELLTKYDVALTEAREIVEIKMMDLQSELDEAERNWRLKNSMKGIADDIRSIMSPTDGEVEWNAAIMIVDSSVNETFASMDMLMDDMSATIANRKLDGSLAVARIAELRQQAAPVRARISDDASTAPLLSEDSVPAINLGAINTIKR